MKKMLPLLGLVLIALGAVGLWAPQTFVDAQPVNIITPPAHEKPTVAVASSSAISGHPVSIKVPRLQIDLQVIDGVYNANTKTWNLTNDKAQYALLTSEPNNQAGNTFIYGHNTKQVFARLLKAQADDIAIVETSNGHQFTYRLTSSREASPTDDSLFHYQGAPILTLQTCSGPNFQYRYLLTFRLVEAA